MAKHHKKDQDRRKPPIGERSRRAGHGVTETDKCPRQCGEFASVEYDFLYDAGRHLFTIGYNVGERRRDSGYYDLLASEARLARFVAIAQGRIPPENWFSLSRPLTETSEGPAPPSRE